MAEAEEDVLLGVTVSSTAGLVGKLTAGVQSHMYTPIDVNSTGTIFAERKRRSQIVREVRDLVSGTRQGVDTKHLRVCFDTFATKKADTGFVNYVKGLNVYRVLDAYGAGLLRSEIAKYIREHGGAEQRLYYEDFVELASKQDAYLLGEWRQAVADNERIRDICGNAWNTRMPQLLAAFDALAASHGDEDGLELSVLGEVISTHCEIISTTEWFDVCGIIGENPHGRLNPEKWVKHLALTYERIGRATASPAEQERMLTELTNRGSLDSGVSSRRSSVSDLDTRKRDKDEKKEKKRKREKEKENADKKSSRSKDRSETEEEKEKRRAERRARKEADRSSRGPSSHAGSEDQRERARDDSEALRQGLADTMFEEEPSYGLLEDAAAERIQASARGKIARKTVEAMKENEGAKENAGAKEQGIDRRSRERRDETPEEREQRRAERRASRQEEGRSSRRTSERAAAASAPSAQSDPKAHPAAHPDPKAHPAAHPDPKAHPAAHPDPKAKTAAKRH